MSKSQDPTTLETTPAAQVKLIESEEAYPVSLQFCVVVEELTVVEVVIPVRAFEPLKVQGADVQLANIVGAAPAESQL